MERECETKCEIINNYVEDLKPRLEREIKRKRKYGGIEREGQIDTNTDTGTRRKFNRTLNVRIYRMRF